MVMSRSTVKEMKKRKERLLAAWCDLNTVTPENNEKREVETRELKPKPLIEFHIRENVNSFILMGLSDRSLSQ